MIDFNEDLWLLASPLLEVRRLAAVRLESLTESEEPLESLAVIADFLFESVSNHFGETKEVSEPLIRLLVKLSHDLEMSSKMVTCGLVRKSIDFLYKHEAPVRGLIVNLLLSLTHHPDGVASFFQNVVVEEDVEVDIEVDGAQVVVEAESERQKLWMFVLRLVNSYCIASRGTTIDDLYLFENVGSLLVNLAKSVVGRKFFLDPTRGLLKQIIQHYDSQSSLWKLLLASEDGASEDGAFNVKCHLQSFGYPCLCFGADDQLVDLIFGADFLWIAVLLPLSGKKVHQLDNDTSKMPIELLSALAVQRELDAPKIRMAALEIIRLVTLRDAGQKALISVNAPCILEVGFEEEVNHKVVKAYSQLGYFSLFERLCSQLAKVECLQSMRLYKKASCMALESLESLCDVSEIDKDEELIMHHLKEKWIINHGIFLLKELVERQHKGNDVVSVLKDVKPRLMRNLFGGPATRVFILLEERYPMLMHYLEVRQDINALPFISRLPEIVKQFNVTRKLFQFYSIPFTFGNRR